MNILDIDDSKMQKITNNYYLLKGQEHFLGSGSFGAVYVGYCVSQKKKIAIKIIYNNSETLQQEIETLSTLNSLTHKNIVGFYGYHVSDSKVYLFIEYCSKGTLSKAIERGLSQLQVLKYFRQIVEGMCYINAKNKLHRDLKPDNILISENGELKVCDFGLARTNTGDVNMSSKLGTLLYGAPQVWDVEKRYNEKCDVFSAGVILYEMLTGERLFKNVSNKMQLKYQWYRLQKGLRRVKYHEKFHPLWEYFTNLMLAYDPLRRLTFHQILEQLKMDYMNMQSEIQTKRFINKDNVKLIKLENYLNYQVQKCDILLKIHNFYKIREKYLPQQIITLISFLNLCRYLKRISNLIENLRNKLIQLPDIDEDLIIDEKKDYKIVLCMKKYRNNLQTSYIYGNEIVKNEIKKVILEYSDKKIINNKIYQQFIEQALKGQFNAQSFYRKRLQMIISSPIFQAIKQKINVCSEQFLRRYAMILIGTKIDQVFTEDKYSAQNYINIFMDRICCCPKDELINLILGY